VSSALNLDSDGLQVVGGCDLYTTKAAGTDKKLYKQIDKKLEAQHESLLRLAASLSPPQAAQFAKTSNLSQSSPFGTLSQISNRRTYAYMIATLNASHPDYDFSHVLRPSDFCREKRLKDVMNDIDSKVYSAQKTSIPRGLQTPGGTLLWGPRMWNMIDAEMDVFNCEVFSYKPEENPFDDEETALWSVHYFFFNKSRKRVCYLYLRALSPSWHGGDDDIEEDDGAITPIRPKRSYSARRSVDFSARKRARYWLGDRADDLEDEWDDGTQSIDEDDGDEEVDVDVELLNEIVKRSRSMSSNMSSLDASDELYHKERSKSHVRAMSDAIAESIEL
jgi:AP-1 complex subunit sigma 1/2